MDNNNVDLKDKLSFTVPEAAKVSGIGENTLRALVFNNEIPYFKIKTKTMISALELREFISKAAKERRIL